MKDLSARQPSSALVVADTKSQTQNRVPAGGGGGGGGCVGIFFKLFDWNRRFGKKKLFPKKLLPPGRVNHVSKKFNADEKHPMPKHKLLLITDAKSGGFPPMNNNVKGGGGVVGSDSEQGHQMRSPSLVAKLMGLESMPPVDPKTPIESSHTPNYDTKSGSGFESDKEIFSLDKGCLRHELQPQKIQKTGVSERRPVSRFGADALQIRNVLSRSRKRHPKLVSPVKSPRAARSSSRLMDAAARILEPGVQGRSRAKYSLTYSNAMKKEVNGEDRMMIDLPAQSGYEVGDPRDFKEQSSCRNCGHVTDYMDSKSDVISEASPDRHNAFFQRVEDRKPRLGKHCVKESQVVLLRSRCQPSQCDTVSPNVQNQWEFPNNPSFHAERAVSPAVALKHRSQVLSKPQNQMLNSGDKVPPRSRRVSGSRAHNQTKDFIALNRNMSQSSVRFPRKPSNVTEVRRPYSVPKSEAMSTQRNVTRRTAATCNQVESTSSSRSTTDKHRSIKSRVVIGNNKASADANSTNTTCLSRTGAEGGNAASQSKDIDVVSFSFSSPLKSKSSSFSATQVDNKGMDQSEFLINDDTCRLKLVEEDNHRNKSSNSFQVKEDAIGALLEQKLKELTHQAECESRTGITPQGRTTASILQELISALTAERPVSPDTYDNVSSTGVMHNLSQGEMGPKRSSMRFSGDRLSPGSVLDASFSNESCVSSCRDDASGHMFQSDDMDVSYDEPQLMHSDADLLDSASSTTTKENSNYTIVPVTHIIDHISSLSQRANLSNMKSYPSYTNEVLLNAEMLFGNVGCPERFVDFLVGPFLDELETLAAAAWRTTVILGFEVSKGDNQNLRTFLFDCLVECLDLRYAQHNGSGFKEWCKLPNRMTMEDLVQVFDYEVRKWASLAMMSTDDVIDWEMSTSLGKWTDFSIEGFESAAEMSQVIFQSLVDEVVADFL